MGGGGFRSRAGAREMQIVSKIQTQSCPAAPLSPFLHDPLIQTLPPGLGRAATFKDITGAVVQVVHWSIIARSWLVSKDTIIVNSAATPKGA